jgi:hypothetical protein
MRMRSTFAKLVLVLGLIAVGSNGAAACGGFFCRTQPMNQAYERILFISDGEVVTTHVQIQFSGNAPDFAWVLPVPTLPDLKVSHNEIFNQLGFATQPNFILNWDDEGECNLFWQVRFTAVEGATDDADGGVEVVSEERIGPYDTAVITADDPEAISNWLTENGYNLDALGVDLLRPYVDGGFYFVALKLASDRELGDLQPLALTYAAQNPGIPIRLTAVATQPDMGVLAWVLGSNRAIPKNYLHVQINEARIDWFNGGFNYPDVVTEAANEAGGQAFATDYAGTSTIMDNRLYRDGQYDLDRLRGYKDPVDFLDDMLRQGFPRDDQTQALIRRHIPMSQTVLEQGVLAVVFRGDQEAYNQALADSTLQATADRSFYNNMEAYRKYLTDFTFDASAFADDLDAVIIEPLRVAQNLMGDYPYLTRLFTTLSADEMTVDPMFDFNPDLPDVSNTRTADARLECPDGDPNEINFEEIVLVVTLKDGREIRSQPYKNRPPGPTLFRSAAAVVEQMDTSGDPVQVRGLSLVSPDFDGSGAVDFDDFVMFAGAYGQKNSEIDLTGDGFVDFSDFIVFARNYGGSAN